jgi:hypothetical protein
MEVEEFTIRLAEILSQAMNALALIASDRLADWCKRH